MDGIILCYHNEGRKAATAALRKAGVKRENEIKDIQTEPWYVYDSKAKVEGNTPRYCVSNATEEQWQAISNYFIATKACGVEIYND